MELMQFTAIVLMIGLTLKLVMLPLRVAENSVTGMSRWLMFSGTALLGLQFFLQLVLGLRDKGVTQAVMLNLTVFTLVSWLLSLAILRLLMPGRLNLLDKWLGGAVWIVELVLITIAALSDGATLLSDTPQLQLAERTGSVLYFAAQCYYGWRNVAQLRRLHQSLDDYYDNDMSQRLAWMQVSIALLAVLAMFVPAVIFVPGRWLAVFAVVFFYGVWYFVDCFCDYVKSSMPGKVQEIEEFFDEQSGRAERRVNSEESSEPKMTDAQLERMDAAIARWTEEGGHRKNGLKKSLVANQMGVSENQLTLWLRQHDTKFADWLSGLRVEEAKRIMQQHPDWTNEAVAAHCGFADRPDFQKKFKKLTDMTPAEWLEQGMSFSS